MRVVDVRLKVPCPTVMETGFGITCGTEVEGARSATAGVAAATCTVRDSGKLTATAATPAGTANRNRRQLRRLRPDRMVLVVLMKPTSSADRRNGGNAGRLTRSTRSRNSEKASAAEDPNGVGSIA